MIPSKLAFSYPSQSYSQNNSIQQNTPIIDSASPMTFSISPELPPGLSLDPATGVISGTPTVYRMPEDYVITASNGNGSASATINFGIEPSGSFVPDQQFPATVPPNLRAHGMTFSSKGRQGLFLWGECRRYFL